MMTKTDVSRNSAARPSAISPRYTRRRGKSRQLRRSDYPFAMTLPDGRTLVITIPGRWTADDRDGSLLLLPPAIAFLDRVQALIIPRTHGKSTPGYITALREALNMTQKEFAEIVGISKMTVSRWERGVLSPSDLSITRIEALRAKRLAQGVLFPA